MINKDIKPELSKDIVWKEEGSKGETISLASYLGGPIRFLNPVASIIIKLSNGKNSIDDIIKEICKTFEDSDPQIVKKDVEKFLKNLEKKEIIKPLKN
jgi:hypothetical protein